MPIKKAALVVTVAAGLAVSVSASAQGYGPAHRAGLAGILASLQLSSAQRQQIHQILSAARTQNAPQMAQLQALRQQMQATLLSSSDVTEAQLLPLEQQQESLRQQLDSSRLQTEIAIRNVLTSAQLAQAASKQAQLAKLHQQEHAITAPSPE
jgi:Spy/CpxP family protein refolding chaperone